MSGNKYSRQATSQEKFALSDTINAGMMDIQRIARPMQAGQNEIFSINCQWTGLARTFSNQETSRFVYLTVQGSLNSSINTLNFRLYNGNSGQTQHVSNLAPLLQEFTDTRAKEIINCLRVLLNDTNITTGQTKAGTKYILIPVEAVEQHCTNYNVTVAPANNTSNNNANRK